MFGVYKLAERYGKEAGSWTLISLFITPMVCIILLWCIGETKEKLKERIASEEVYRMTAREGIICTNCQSINDRNAKFCIGCGKEL